MAINKLKDKAVAAEIAKKNKDLEKRERTEDLDKIEIRLLEKMAREDLNQFVRLEAMKSISDKAFLTDIALSDPIYFVRNEAVTRLEDQTVLKEIALKDPAPAVRETAVKKLTDQAAFAEVARKDSRMNIRLMAIRNLTDQAILLEIYKKDPYADVKLLAVKKLTDQKILAEIAKKDSLIFHEAVKRLTDQVLLADVAQKASDWEVRLAAIRKLEDQRLMAEITKNDPDERVRKAIEEDPTLIKGVLISKTGKPLAGKTVYFLPIDKGGFSTTLKKGTKIGIRDGRIVKAEYTNPSGKSNAKGEFTIEAEQSIVQKHQEFSVGFLNISRAEPLRTLDGAVITFKIIGFTKRIDLGRITVK